MKYLLAFAAVAGLAGVASADGFYFRVAVGPSFTHGSLDAPATTSTSNGAGVSTQIAVGWSVRPGLVIGAGTFPAITPGPSYSAVDAGGQHVSATGPFVDYYVTDGVHAFAGALFAAGYLDGGDRDSHVGLGWGATAGVGYDHAVSTKWSLGGIARVTIYQLYGVDDSITLVAPAALFTATYR
ncbi:MAG TPA: hypothetical protein VGM90_13570 [Kofleriaceae bacterium]|jgi:hypothetical protein